MNRRQQNILNRLIAALGLSLLTISLVPHQASAATISAQSYVNLQTDVDEQVSREPYTSVSASASTNISEASSEASWDLKFKTFASSEGEGLSYPAIGVASFLGTLYLNNWEENSPLPITLNFRFTGSVSATSEAIKPGSLGLANLSLLIETSDVIWSNNLRLQHQGGIPILTSGERFTITSVNTDITVVPNISYLSDKITLSLEDLECLDLEMPPISGSFEEYVLEISQAIFEQGLKNHGISPGAQLPISVDLQASFNAAINLSLDIFQNEALFIVMQSSAQSTPSASAAADFRNTLTLESITIPANFELPPGSEPYIEFDSGLVVPVTKVQTVPEPLSILGSATALGFGAFFKRKLKPSKSTEKETTKVG